MEQETLVPYFCMLAVLFAFLSFFLHTMFLLHPDIFAWDLAILILLALCMSGAFVCGIWLMRTKSGMLQRSTVSALFLAAAVCGTLVAYGSFLEPQMLVVTKRTADLPLREPLTIVAMGDFHVGPYKGRSSIERAVRAANAQLPDLIFLTGDYILGDDADLSALNALGELQASLGVFAVLGNHDVGHLRNPVSKNMRIKQDRSQEIRDHLTGLGIRVLVDENTQVSSGQSTIAIAGINDLWTRAEDLEAALDGIPAGMPTILLSHNPGIILDERSRAADLIISGHTHGGQIRLPYIGALSFPATDLGREYVYGDFAIDDGTTLVITRGVGESSARARLFAWPEVLVLRTEPRAAVIPAT